MQIRSPSSLDLKKIALQARNAEYNPKRFGAVIMRINNPKSCALIFASGKVVCTGTKTEANARLALRKYAKAIQMLGVTVTKCVDFKIMNIMATIDLGIPIRLESLHTKRLEGENAVRMSTYEPELFPGLIYLMPHRGLTLLVFVSGKITITGAKDVKDVNESLDEIRDLVWPFRKGTREQDADDIH
jgi:transcription initiation factor TFIID TATA-box-binding protein